MITARIIADSVTPSGNRLTSFVLTYPRFIHSEMMTHRVFSRNAASSRAIPVEKMMQAVREDPAGFELYGSNKPGMQAGAPLDSETKLDVQLAISRLRGDALACVQSISEKGLHKQNANRYLEPWAHITVLATATDAGLANFFALRAHSAAQPEFQVLAFRMLAAYLASEPRKLEWGDWHIPDFPNPSGPLGFGMELAEKIKIATARCARLSYLTFDGEHSPAKDIKLHDDLAAAGHWSPFEHCAQAVDFDHCFDYTWSNFDNGGTPCNWQQYRKQFKDENRAKVDLAAIMAAKPEWVTV